MVASIYSTVASGRALIADAGSVVSDAGNWLGSLPTEYADYRLQVARLRSSPVFRGEYRRARHGLVVVMVPGLLGGPWTMEPLAEGLRNNGHTVFHWEGGTNWYDVHRSFGLVLRSVRHVVRATGRLVVCLTHSAGGPPARAAAQLMSRYFLGVGAVSSPQNIDEVPLTVDPFLGRIYGMAVRLQDRGRCRQECGFTSDCRMVRVVTRRLPSPLRGLAIRTDSDRSVDPRNCKSPEGNDRVVDATHFGIVAHPETLAHLLDFLAEIADEIGPGYLRRGVLI